MASWYWQNSILRKHNWGFEGLGSNSFIGPLHGDHRMVMRDLWHEPMGDWDRDRVKEIYGQELGIEYVTPLSLKMVQLIELYGSTRPMVSTLLNRVTRGSSSKSLVMVLIRYFGDSYRSSRFPPKVRVFAWRLGHDLLPTNAKIVTINQNFNNGCPRCSLTEESFVLALRDRPFAKEILQLDGVDNRILASD